MNASRTPARRSPFRHITARPRLASSTVLGIVLYFVQPDTERVATRLLIGWNVAAFVYIVLALVMMLRATEQTIRRRAAQTDESRFAVLAFSTLAAVAAVGAILAELLTVKGTSAAVGLEHIALSVSAILTAWTFIHIIFTQHYAHEFYIEHRRDDKGTLIRGAGLDFPGGGTPVYVDFLYFSFTIGVASQTADISISSRQMRIVALLHSILSYFFNTTILALTINIASGMM